MATDEGFEAAGDAGDAPAWIASEAHTAQVYDLIADHYAGYWFDRVSADLAAPFLARVPVGGTVLDAGCGPGQYTRHFWEQRRRPVGVDISARTIAGAMDRCGLPLFARMSIAALGFPDAVFDGVWDCASVQHFPRDMVARPLAEFHRVLKPRGVLFVNVPLGDGQRIETPEVFGVSAGYGRFFQRYPDADDFRKTLATCGFDVLTAWPAEVSSSVLDPDRPVAARWLNVIAVKGSRNLLSHVPRTRVTG